MKKFAHAGTNRALFVCFISLFVALLLPKQVLAGAGDTTIYLPLTINHTGSANVTLPNPNIPNSNNCALNPQEEQIAAFFKSAEAQNRDSAKIVCNSILAKVARERAEDMARRNYFGHTNPSGLGPNYLVTIAGYRLPSFYDSRRDGNNIESIAAGYTTPVEVWDGWMHSEKHRTHLMAEKSFYAEQIEYGIGYYYSPDSKYKHYWVVITAYSETN